MSIRVPIWNNTHVWDMIFSGKDQLKELQRLKLKVIRRKVPTQTKNIFALRTTIWIALVPLSEMIFMINAIK